ncbi:EamA family transporter, partial [Acinetobacter pittii]
PQHLLQPAFWPKALLIAVLATVIPYALDLFALQRLTKLSYGTLSSLSPALAALAGLILLHEQITALQWLALGCVILASIGVTFKKKVDLAT